MSEHDDAVALARRLSTTAHTARTADAHFQAETAHNQAAMSARRRGNSAEAARHASTAKTHRHAAKAAQREAATEVRRGASGTGPGAMMARADIARLEQSVAQARSTAERTSAPRVSTPTPRPVNAPGPSSQVAPTTRAADSAHARNTESLMRSTRAAFLANPTDENRRAHENVIQHARSVYGDAGADAMLTRAHAGTTAHRQNTEGNVAAARGQQVSLAPTPTPARAAPRTLAPHVESAIGIANNTSMEAARSDRHESPNARMHAHATAARAHDQAARDLAGAGDHAQAENYRQIAQRHRDSAAAAGGRRPDPAGYVGSDDPHENARIRSAQAEHASATAKTEGDHRKAASAHDHAAHAARTDAAVEHHRRKAAEHTSHADRAKRGGLPLPHAHGAKAPEAPRALKKGKKGGTFYVSDTGRKVYTKGS